MTLSNSLLSLLSGMKLEESPYLAWESLALEVERTISLGRDEKIVDYLPEE
ncbi:hypothetical protein [Photorhabdus akhurstii]|uniref:hypothetical protein n=1 Tax=Photorhabdus akhurstii TaxID=171438 RepID=UPI0015E3E343